MLLPHRAPTLNDSKYLGRPGVRAKTNYTVVIVTHNMQLAARVFDLTAFFLLGRLIEAGPTDQRRGNLRLEHRLRCDGRPGASDGVHGRPQHQLRA